MFDWRLCVFLVLVSIPGVVVTIVNLTPRMETMAKENLPPGKTLPSRAVMTAATMGQSVVLIAAASAAGTALAPRVGLGAPFFQALLSGQPLWPALQPQLVPALGLGVGGAVVFVAAYYFVFRPRLDGQAVRSLEAMRMELGPWARLLYGGIVEEVLMRWGVMTCLAWIGATLTGGATSAVMWAAILVSGVLFGIGHLPSFRLGGSRVTPGLLTTTIVLNLWAAIVFGWLFWQYGLLAAMMAHMLYHLVWLPFDRHFYRRTEQQMAAQNARHLQPGW